MNGNISDAKSENNDELLRDWSLTEFPTNFKLLSDYRHIETLKKSSCHEISRYEYITSDEIKIFFYKKNEYGSIGPVLEAVSAGFSALIAPEYTAQTYAVYDENCKNVGVMSEEILDFKPSSQDGLKESDLQSSVLEKISIVVLEELYQAYRNIQDHLMTLLRQERKIDLERIIVFKKMEVKLTDYDSHETMLPCPPMDLRPNIVDAGLIADNVMAETKKNIIAKLRNYELRTEALRELDRFYIDMFKRYKITKEDFNSYLILRGHAYAFVTAILGQDADFHRNNFTKYGMRFDFDMTMWPILYQYKRSNLKIFRRPDENMFKLSAHDVIHFPNIRNARPFYWPTWTVPVLSGEYFEKIRPYLNFSANAYSEKDTYIYRKLEKNKVFSYHKFVAMLRYILTSDEMYKIIISSHIAGDDCPKSLIDSVLGCQNRLRGHMESLLLSVKEFSEFFIEFGSDEVEKFVKHLAQDGRFNIRLVHDKFNALNKLIKKNFNEESKNHDGRYVFLPENEQAKQEKLINQALDFPIDSEFAILDINDIKKIILQKMQAYIAESECSIIKMFGFFGQNVPVAKAIIAYCSHADTSTGSPRQNICASDNLYEFLKAKKEDVQPGKMYKIIEELLAQIESSIEYAPKGPQSSEASIMG